MQSSDAAGARPIRRLLHRNPQKSLSGWDWAHRAVECEPGGRTGTASFRVAGRMTNVYRPSGPRGSGARDHRREGAAAGRHVVLPVASWFITQAGGMLPSRWTPRDDLVPTWRASRRGGDTGGTRGRTGHLADMHQVPRIGPAELLYTPEVREGLARSLCDALPADVPVTVSPSASHWVPTGGVRASGRPPSTPRELRIRLRAADGTRLAVERGAAGRCGGEGCGGMRASIGLAFPARYSGPPIRRGGCA